MRGSQASCARGGGGAMRRQAAPEPGPDDSAEARRQTTDGDITSGRLTSLTPAGCRQYRLDPLAADRRACWQYNMAALPSISANARRSLRQPDTAS